MTAFLDLRCSVCLFYCAVYSCADSCVCSVARAAHLFDAYLEDTKNFIERQKKLKSPSIWSLSGYKQSKLVLVRVIKACVQKLNQFWSFSSCFLLSKLKTYCVNEIECKPNLLLSVEIYQTRIRSFSIKRFGLISLLMISFESMLVESIGDKKMIKLKSNFGTKQILCHLYCYVHTIKKQKAPFLQERISSI